MIPLRWEQSRIASATSATGLTVGCTDSLLLDVPLRTFWPPYSQTFDLFRPKRPRRPASWRGDRARRRSGFPPAAPGRRRKTLLPHLEITPPRPHWLADDTVLIGPVSQLQIPC